MPAITEIAAMPNIHQFQARSSHPVGFESDFGYHEPTKMNNTARILTTVPTTPHTYSHPREIRRASSNLAGAARLAKKMSRNSRAVEMHHTMVRPAYSAKKYLFESPSPAPRTTYTRIVMIAAFAGTLFLFTFPNW